MLGSANPGSRDPESQSRTLEDGYRRQSQAVRSRSGKDSRYLTQVLVEPIRLVSGSRPIVQHLS